MSRRPRGVTRRDPPKAVKEHIIPVAASLSGSSITSGQIAPEYLGAGTRDGTKFLRDDGTWQTLLGGALDVRGSVDVTTASLLHNGVEDGTVALGKAFMLLRVSADRPCRVRLYSTAAARAADAAREPGTDPEGEHGLIVDLVFAPSNLTLDLAPMVIGACLEDTVVSSVPYAIQNLSGSTSTVAVSFTRLNLENIL